MFGTMPAIAGSATVEPAVPVLSSAHRVGSTTTPAVIGIAGIEVGDLLIVAGMTHTGFNVLASTDPDWNVIVEADNYNMDSAAHGVQLWSRVATLVDTLSAINYAPGTFDFSHSLHHMALTVWRGAGPVDALATTQTGLVTVGSQLVAPDVTPISDGSQIASFYFYNNRFSTPMPDLPPDGDEATLFSFVGPTTTDDDIRIACHYKPATGTAPHPGMTTTTTASAGTYAVIHALAIGPVA